jgi:DNA-binding LacI/PurR family transcriptional regulator
MRAQKPTLTMDDMLRLRLASKVSEPTIKRVVSGLPVREATAIRIAESAARLGLKLPEAVLAR